MDYKDRKFSDLWQMLEEETSKPSLEKSIAVMSLSMAYAMNPQSGVLEDINHFYEQTKELTKEEIAQQYGDEFCKVLYEGLPKVIEGIFESHPMFKQHVPKEKLDSDPEARRRFMAGLVSSFVSPDPVLSQLSETELLERDEQLKSMEDYF